jgi:tRNA(Met) cytidine acetyltransferase
MANSSPPKSTYQNEIIIWLQQLSDQLQEAHQRLVLSIQGDQSWCTEQFRAVQLVYTDVLVISDRQLGECPVSFASIETRLGSESSVVVVDLFDGLNPDVLCIASGLVRCGGLLILLSPAPHNWGTINDRYGIWQDNAVSRSPLFVEYIFNSISDESNGGLTVMQGRDMPPVPELLRALPTPLISGKTAEQSTVMSEIDHWLFDQKRSIALITADRGRGKSTCLGFILSDLTVSRHLSVLVTAPSRQCAAILMLQAKLQSETELEIDFVAPDGLIADQKPADVLIIDEAAMLPYAMLLQLCRQYPRVVMATTTGGYEGTGQGFLLRFVARLPKQQLLQQKLSLPVRWASGDRLEMWLESTMLLKPALGCIPMDDGRRSSCKIRVLDEAELANNLVLLEKIYSLMTSAHYRSRPSDLRMLMENPQLLVILAEVGDDLIGVALLNQEGGLDRELCEQVHLGFRRPKGHLLAQMITAQAGDKFFANYEGLRIQRIAVLEPWRRTGLGRQLIETATRHAEVQGFDYIGASFAFDHESAAFWKCCQFSLVHIGFALGKSSGNHSVAVLRSLNQELDGHISQLQDRIQNYLPVWLCQFLQVMDAANVVALLNYCRFHSTMSKLDLDEVQVFACGHKGFELCFGSLQRYVMQKIASLPGDACIHPWLIEKAVQNRDWNRLDRYGAMAGRKQAQQKLRDLVKSLLANNSNGISH